VISSPNLQAVMDRLKAKPAEVMAKVNRALDPDSYPGMNLAVYSAMAYYARSEAELAIARDLADRMQVTKLPRGFEVTIGGFAISNEIKLPDDAMLKEGIKDWITSETKKLDQRDFQPDGSQQPVEFIAARVLSKVHSQPDTFFRTDWEGHGLLNKTGLAAFLGLGAANSEKVVEMLNAALIALKIEVRLTMREILASKDPY
jgi:hypothetical protein